MAAQGRVQAVQVHSPPAQGVQDHLCIHASMPNWLDVMQSPCTTEWSSCRLSTKQGCEAARPQAALVLTSLPAHGHCKIYDKRVGARHRDPDSME